MSSPQTADEWVKSGEDSLGASRWADSVNEYQESLASARDCFDRAIVLEPSHRQAHLGRAEVLVKLGEFETAADAYVSVLQLTPTPNASLLVAAARALSHAERAEAALAACDEALALAPADLEARVLKAELLSRLRRDEAAVEAWNVALSDTALEKDWRIVRSKLERAMALDRLAHPDAAHAFAAAFEAHFDKLTASPSAATFHTALQTSALARREWSACLERVAPSSNGGFARAVHGCRRSGPMTRAQRTSGRSPSIRSRHARGSASPRRTRRRASSSRRSRRTTSR